MSSKELTFPAHLQGIAIGISVTAAATAHRLALAAIFCAAPALLIYAYFLEKRIRARSNGGDSDE